MRRSNSTALLAKITFLAIIGFLFYAYQDKIKVYINSWLNDVPHISYASNETFENISGELYTYVSDNKPAFTEDMYLESSYEKYSDLDYLGRAGVAIAIIGQDLMPTEERGSIGMVKPTGWHTIKYDHIPGKYLYNRCHLIGYQLTGENANEKNLITCTRSMNTEGMLKWENEVANYVKKTNNHVLYRVTPVYENDNLLASGVQIEAYSIEDNGKGVSFNVFVFNTQDKIEINYANGDSKLKDNS